MKRFAFGAGAVLVGLGTVYGCADSLAPAIPNVDGGADGGTPPPAAQYAIGGTVSGLAGTGMVLQNNSGDDITVNANGTFVFATKLATGKPFDVSVKNQPTAPSQTCSVTAGKGTVGTGNVTTVVVSCATNAFTVGGQVSGLAGEGLVLQNNAGNDVTVSANGTFAFPALLAGADYAVTVKSQPTNLSQTCTVTNGTGKITSTNVGDVAVSCVTNKYKIGGTVTGLDGTGLVLQNNAGDDLTITADGTFSFVTSQADGTGFAVTVKTGPSGPEQTCLVAGGTGTLVGGDVSSITVNCTTKKYAIGGTIAGLAGKGLVLQNNAGDEAPVNANGTFAFPTPIDDLASYAVTVKTQPTNPWQTCTVNNGTGNVAAAAVESISVTCTTKSFLVKGTVTGLAGAGLVLQNNAGDDLAIADDGSFEFATSVASGAGYLVSVLTNPTNKSQTCTVTKGEGKIAGTDVTDVAITCVTNHYSIGGAVTGLAGGNDVVLQNNAGDDLTVAADGKFTFGTTIESGQTYAVTVKTQPTTPNQTCVVTGETGAVTAGNVVSVSVNCTTNTYTAGGTVTGLAGTGLVLQNNAGDDLPLNANGTFAFSPQADGTGYAVTVKTQPTAKSQTCSVTSAWGTIAGANVGSVAVACVTNKYSVGGTITGLTAAGLVLQNNAGDDVSPVNGQTTFTFPTQVASGDAYAVTVKTQPVGVACSVANANGTVGGSSVSNVALTCKVLPGGQLGPDYSSEGYTQCVGYRDAVNVEDIPNSGWADNCKTGSSLRVACGANAGSVRYIDVSKNVFALGLAGYPESGLITNASFAPINNVIYASDSNPNSGTSWWNGGDGCNENATNITINNGCSWEASNCFGQNLSGDRYLYVYTKP